MQGRQLLDEELEGRVLLLLEVEGHTDVNPRSTIVLRLSCAHPEARRGRSSMLHLNNKSMIL